VLQTVEGLPKLAILPARAASRHAADRLGTTLDKILAEPLQMAAVVDGVVVVTLAGQTNQNALSSVLNSLNRLKVRIIGVTLNEVYYHYGYYGEYYSKYHKPTRP
jgi:hypothetical protein